MLLLHTDGVEGSLARQLQIDRGDYVQLVKDEKRKLMWKPPQWTGCSAILYACQGQ